jgi:hypothetical protein
LFEQVASPHNRNSVHSVRSTTLRSSNKPRVAAVARSHKSHELN